MKNKLKSLFDQTPSQESQPLANAAKSTESIQG